MKVLMVSRYFPVGHPRVGEPTKFVEKIESGEKIHTIRANAKGHFKDGELVSIRYWSGMPYRSKQVEFSQKVIRLESIILGYEARAYTVNRLFAVLETQMACVWTLASNDGLGFEDFANWFFPAPSGDVGVQKADILHFTDFRYAGGGR